MTADEVGDEVQGHLAESIPSKVVPPDEPNGCDRHGLVRPLDRRDQRFVTDADEVIESRHPRRRTGRRRGPRRGRHAARRGSPGRRIRAGGRPLLPLHPGRRPTPFAVLHDVRQGLRGRLAGTHQTRKGRQREQRCSRHGLLLVWSDHISPGTSTGGPRRRDELEQPSYETPRLDAGGLRANSAARSATRRAPAATCPAGELGSPSIASPAI